MVVFVPRCDYIESRGSFHAVLLLVPLYSFKLKNLANGYSTEVMSPL